MRVDGPVLRQASARDLCCAFYETLRNGTFFRRSRAEGDAGRPLNGWVSGVLRSELGKRPEVSSLGGLRSLVACALLLSAIAAAQPRADGGVLDPSARAEAPIDAGTHDVRPPDAGTSRGGRAVQQVYPPPDETFGQEPVRARRPGTLVYPPTQELVDSPVVVTLSDGQQLRGRLVSRDERQVVLALADGARLSLAASSVASVESTSPGAARDARIPGGVRLDPNRTRYLYGPSAMMLREGQLTFSQKELLFSTLAYGVTDNFSVQVGSVLPALFLGLNGLNLIGAVKVGGEVSPKLHVAGGVQALLLGMGGGGAALGLLFGSVTYGDEVTQGTFSGGVGAATAGDALGAQALFSLSGSHRFAENFAVVSENWVVPATDQYMGTVVINGIALRIMGDHLAVDVGGVIALNHRGMLAPIPIPWLDFTYNF